MRPPIADIERAGRARAVLRLLEAGDRPRAKPSIDRADLERVVGQVRRPQADPGGPTWWERFVQWVRDQLPQLDWEPPQWLDDLGYALSWLGLLVYWLGVVLLAGALGLLVWAIVRWLRRYGPDGSERARGSSGRPSDKAPPLRLEGLRGADAGEQAVGLLRYAIAVLRQAGRLPAAPGKTDTELAALLPDDGARTRERFLRIAACAERCLYGGRCPAADELEQCFGDARVLAGDSERAS